MTERRAQQPDEYHGCFNLRVAVAAALAVALLSVLPAGPPAYAGTLPRQTGGPFCILIYPPPPECASAGLGSLFGFAIPGLGDLDLGFLFGGFQFPAGGLFSLFGTSPSPPAPADTAVVHFGAHAVQAEIAATPSERARGLSSRTSLAPDAGMLFLFPAPTTTGFWMKDTLIPLSLAYMRKTGDRTYSVLSIVDMEPCRADPCPTYPPGTAYDAALEVNRGWFADRGIGPGAEATVEGDLPAPS